MNYRVIFTVSIVLLLNLSHHHGSQAWLYACKRVAFGYFTVQKRCILESVLINEETPLYRVFFPPVDLVIDDGAIPDFSRDVAGRMSAKTKQLTMRNSRVGRFFLKDTLEFAELSNNVIEEVLFDSAEELNVWMLRLNHNLLGNISFVRDMKTLVILGLSNNQISSVSWDTFRKLDRLKTLDLGGNPIKELDTTSNLNLVDLRSLILAGNNLTMLDIKPLTMPKLENLNISSNQLVTLNLFDFDRSFPAVSTVDLRNNPWNCERLRRFEDKLLLRGATKRRSPSAVVPQQKVTCREDHLESIALTTPDEVDSLSYDFQALESFYRQLLAKHDTNRRLYTTKERISYLDYDLNAISSAVYKLREKINHLFKLYGQGERRTTTTDVT